MDLLEQYKSDHPEAFREKPREAIAVDQPLLIRLVMQWSGGMVRDVRQAQYVLLGVAAVAVLAAAILFFNFLRGPRPPSPDKIVPIAGPAAEMRR
ncbi:MAG: hypothetical protein AAB916_02765 [Patescibacteria group bacterium]